MKRVAIAHSLYWYVLYRD